MMDPLEYFDPDPPKKAKAIDGWLYCQTCKKPQPAPGHECAPEDLGPWGNGLRLDQWIGRAEFAESLLCAMAFAHQVEFGRESCGCLLCDSARNGE